MRGLSPGSSGWRRTTWNCIELAAPLHDLGKLGIPDAILLKPGKLSPAEFEIMQDHCRLGGRTFEPLSSSDWEAYRHHPWIGEKILDVAASPILEMAARIALTHHEKWNGTGYPAGLARGGNPHRGAHHRSGRRI